MRGLVNWLKTPVTGWHRCHCHSRPCPKGCRGIQHISGKGLVFFQLTLQRLYLYVLFCGCLSVCICTSICICMCMCVLSVCCKPYSSWG